VIDDFEHITQRLETMLTNNIAYWVAQSPGTIYLISPSATAAPTLRTLVR
jgi:hypothetical protein